MIAWHDFLGYYSSNVSIRTFDAGGIPTPNQPWGLQIDESGDYYTGGDAYKFDSPPDLDVSPHGDFVVVWGSYFPDGGTVHFDVMARAFDRTATARGEKMVVNTTLTSAQSGPAIAMHEGGQLVVTWRSFGQDGDGGGHCRPASLSGRAPGAAGHRSRAGAPARGGRGKRHGAERVAPVHG